MPERGRGSDASSSAGLWPAVLTNLPQFQVDPWREVSLLALLVMELTWVGLWFSSLSPAESRISPWRAAVTLGGVVAGVSLAVRIMGRLRLRLAIRRWVIAGWLLASVLVGLRLLLFYREPLTLGGLFTLPLRAFTGTAPGLPQEVFTLLAILIAGWRGVTLAQEYHGPQAVRRSFQLGAVMLALYLLIHVPLDGGFPGSGFYLFMFSGLLAMGSARVAVLVTLRGGQRLSFDRRWIAGLALSVAGTVGVAAGLGTLAGMGATLLVRLLVGVVLVLVMILSIPFALILLVGLTWLFENLKLEDSPVGDVLENVLLNLRMLVEDLGDMMSGLTGLLAFLNALWRTWGPMIIGLGIAALVFTLVGVIVFRLRSLLESGRELTPFQVDDQEEIGDLWVQMRRSLQARLDELAAFLDQNRRRRADPRHRAAARIRDIYAQLLELSADLGQARPIAVTPLEFLPRLQGLLPSREDDLALITHRYIQVRYGELPESLQEVQTIEAAWERVTEEGKALRMTRKAARHAANRTP